MSEVRRGRSEVFDQIDSFDPFGGDRREELASERVLVVEERDEVVGYVTFSPAGFIGRPFVHFLAVAPSFQRRGLACELLEAVMRRLGSGRLFISTEADNQPMLRLLEREGWEVAGSVEGVNKDETPECFFYRDFSAQPG